MGPNGYYSGTVKIIDFGGSLELPGEFPSIEKLDKRKMVSPITYSTAGYECNFMMMI